MDDDINAAKALKEKFPNKILLVRYEDIALNPKSETQKILNFLDLEFKKSISDFLESHTSGPLISKQPKNITTISISNAQNSSIFSATNSDVISQVETVFPTTTVQLKSPVAHQLHSHHLPMQFDTFRNSKDNAYAWKKHLNISTVKFIQKVCSVPMMKLGFNLMTDESQLTDPKFEVLSVTKELKSMQQYPIKTL